MSFVQLLRVVKKNLIWIVLIPILVGILVYFLSSKLPVIYRSSTSIYTGATSGSGNANGEKDAPTDYFAVNTAFENLLTTLHSRQTLQDVALKLLSQHLLLAAPDAQILGDKGFAELGSVTAEERALVVVPGNFNATLEKVKGKLAQPGENFVVKRLSSKSGYYSLSVLGNNLNASRKKSSDFLDISYSSDDPGVSYHTLKFLNESFVDKYQVMKGAESVNVLKWFESRLHEANNNLKGAEERLKDFGIRNKVINYYEQAKAVAIENESNETGYYKELMAYEAHKRAVTRLEDQLESREILLRNNDELNRIREELAMANEEYERAKIYSNSNDKVKRLAGKVDALKQEIKLWVLQYYSLNHTVESVPKETVLNNWLQETMGMDGSEARLQVYIDRRKDFDRKYSEYSPVNMEISRLEREINVAEREYLEVLHGYHLARMRQQNTEVSGRLQIMDQPDFPTQASDTRRWWLTLFSFFGCFILLAGFFILRELLDSRIRNTTRAEELTGLRTFSALPDRNQRAGNYPLARIENTLLDYAVSNLKIELDNHPPVSGNYLITLISSREMEGKSYAAQRLAEKLYSLDYSVLYISNDPNLEDGETEDRRFRTLRYDITSRLFSAKNEDNLLPEFSRVNRSAFNFVILEIPAISVNAIPNQLIRNSQLSLLLIDARRSWTAADENILKLYRKASGADTKIMLWLNQVAAVDLENLVGEVTNEVRSYSRPALSTSDELVEITA